MAGFENQPPDRRSRTNSAVNDDTLSDVSTSKDMSDALRTVHGREAYETYKRLQSDYDQLLTKYAQAENTIDQLRIGAKLNLYSDLPPPQKSSFVTVSGGKQPHVFNFQRPSQATLSSPASNIVTAQSNGTTNTVSTNTPESDKLDLDQLSPQVRAEGLRTALMFKIPTLQENVEDLQSHVTDGQWGESELRELKDVCNQLSRQHEDMKHELIQAKQLERDNTSMEGNFSSDASDFLHEDDLEGQLYRLGLRLDEINEQIEQNLHQFSNGSNEIISNSRPSLPKEAARQNQIDPELSDLMTRLRNVKEAAKNGDILSRSANSLADVEDLEYNEANGVQRGHDDFTFGVINDHSDDSDHGKKRDSHNGGIDLQESGYFASETMSVSHDNSDPISNHYLSNSANGHPLGERFHDACFDEQSELSSPGRERPLSDSSMEPSPDTRRSSQRSRSSTIENQPADPLTFYPQYPASTPVDPSPPQASSNVLTEQTRHQPHADRRESRPRAVTTDSRHSLDSSKDTRKTKPQKADILRTEHDNPRNRSHELLHDRSHDYSRHRTRSLGDDISPRDRGLSAYSLESSPRRDMKTANERRHGRHRTSLSSADSRVSTPLFHPDSRPKDGTKRDKVRPPTAETERGFDSGFFGSEGSRGSRFARTPEVLPQSKIIHPAVREQAASESDRERFRPQVSHTPVKNSKRESRRRRSYLQSLSESDEDRDLEPSPPILRPSVNQRERRGHRHTPTFPSTRSDSERSRRLDGNLRRPSSSPNIYELPDRSVRSDLLRGSKSQLRPDSFRKSVTDQERSARLGPRSDHDRPMDKQSMRSYPGMDRESVRSGRRSRRDDDSTSGYSDGGRKQTRDRVDKLQGELQRLRTQLQDEASARNLQAEMYGDLRRKHDDLEREIARRNAEQQMKTMYEDLQKKYEDLSKRNDQPRDSATQVDLNDDLKRRLEELSLQVNDLKNCGVGETGHVRFLCPFCGGCNGHHHGSYYYPGYAGTPPVNGTPGTPSHSMGTQTDGISHQTRYPSTPQTRYPSTPQATSTPYYNGYHSAPVNHYHTSTYPGGVPSGSPIHHIHHLPEGRSRDRYDDEYSSDEDDRHRSRRRGSSYRNSRRRTRDFYPEEELDSHRLHLSLDEANKAARRMQRLSKKMLNSVASDLIRSGHR